jgi:hypothetical protein
MGVVKKAIDSMPRANAIPTIIFVFPFITSHPRSFAQKKSLFSCGLDGWCNETFQILKQLISGVPSLDFLSETCVLELCFSFWSLPS